MFEKDIYQNFNFGIGNHHCRFLTPKGVAHLKENDEKPDETPRLTEEQKAIAQLLGQFLAQKNSNNSDEKEPKKLIGFP